MKRNHQKTVDNMSKSVTINVKRETLEIQYVFGGQAYGKVR